MKNRRENLTDAIRWRTMVCTYCPSYPPQEFNIIDFLVHLRDYHKLNKTMIEDHLKSRGF